MGDATKVANLAANLRSRPPWMGGVVLEVGERDLLLAHTDGEPARIAAAVEKALEAHRAGAQETLDAITVATVPGGDDQ